MIRDFYAINLRIIHDLIITASERITKMKYGEVCKRAKKCQEIRKSTYLICNLLLAFPPLFYNLGNAFKKNEVK